MTDRADIYYIEDDQSIALVVKEYLEQKNFQVIVCATLGQARQRIKEKVPSLILLDWNMPDGRGDSLCQWIRSRWKELPILLFVLAIFSSVALAYYLAWRNVRRIRLAEVLRDDTMM